MAERPAADVVSDALRDHGRARRVLVRRLEAGLTQAELAARAGVSATVVSAIERGRPTSERARDAVQAALEELARGGDPFRASG